MEQEQIGKFILQLRKEKNMTQKDLAEKLGVTDRAISKWENGRGLPELSLIKPLCDELGISVNELLSGEKIGESNYQESFEENILNTIEYANKKMKRKNRIILYVSIVAVMIFLIFLGAVGWIVYDSMFPIAKPIEQFRMETLESFIMYDEENKEITISETELEMLIAYINDAVPTRDWTKNEVPYVSPYYVVEIEVVGGKHVFRYNIYEEEGTAYIEEPYNGVYEIDKGAIYIIEQ